MRMHTCCFIHWSALKGCGACVLGCSEFRKLAYYRAKVAWDSFVHTPEAEKDREIATIRAAWQFAESASKTVHDDFLAKQQS